MCPTGGKSLLSRRRFALGAWGLCAGPETFWSVVVANRRGVSQNDVAASRKLVFGLRRSPNGKHKGEASSAYINSDRVGGMIFELIKIKGAVKGDK